MASEHLYTSFRNRGLRRLNQENYIKVTYSAYAINKIKAYIYYSPDCTENPAVDMSAYNNSISHN